MKPQTKVRCSVLTAALLTLHPVCAEEPLPEMSFFEFLGATIEDNGEYIDPLTLHDESVGDENSNGTPHTAADADKPQQQDNDGTASAEVTP